MQQPIAKTIAVFVGALLFNLIFWNEKQGINVLLFDVFIGGVLFQFNAAAFKTRGVQIIAAGTFIAAFLIILHNSLIVKTIHALSFSIFVGLVQQMELRFLGSACLVYLFNLFSAPIHFVESLRELPILRGTEQATRRLRSAWLTMLIVPIFFIIYFVANPKFAELSGKVFDQLWNWLSFDLNITRFLFLILGIFLVGGAIWQHKNANILSIEQDLTDDLTNNNDSNEADDYASTHAADLQDRYKNALNLTITLNILLFINNVLDIQNVWFSNNTLLSAGELKQFVHSGTYVLIFGIALAIGVTLVLFRGILNFVENAKILRGGAYAWLVQNAVLAVSVGMRNWRYIDAYGLAYKRIGVFIFLLLVLFGLGFIYLKINQKRTFFFFINRSAWAIYGVLLLACFVNWDAFISKYNLTTATKSGTVDARFLLQNVSEKNLKVLIEYRSELLKKMPNQPFSDIDYNDYSQPLFKGEGEKSDFIDNQIHQKRAHFEYEQSTFSWLSWNYADAQIKDYLATHK